MGGEDGSVVLVDQVIVDDLEVAVGVDEDFPGVEGGDGFELTEGVGAGL